MVPPEARCSAPPYSQAKVLNSLDKQRKQNPKEKMSTQSYITWEAKPIEDASRK